MSDDDVPVYDSEVDETIVPMTLPMGDVTVSDLSEDNMALKFVTKHEDVLRYVGQWQKWMIFTGGVWEVDHKLQVYDKARRVIRDIAKRLFNGEMQRTMEYVNKLMITSTELDKKQRIKEAKKRAIGIAKPIKSNRTLHGVVSLSRHDTRIASSVDVWDSNPWLLNTPDGTIDLKGGFIRKHNPIDYLTMQTTIGPSNDVPTRWLEFMKQITDGDEVFEKYLQRILGYCLTGTTGEQAMFFAYGAGANGKSVILNVVSAILGPYHRTAPMETFVQSNDNRHPTELANLRGARIVSSTETQAGRKWDEVKIKRLTGGDMIAARFMRQDFFEFMPQFKLFLSGNHKPAIANVDEAMRRRFNLIPFSVIIPPEKRDPFLVNKLQEEAGGILSWLMDGCQEWQRMGLAPPEAVTNATAEYMSLEDHFTAWWQECCEPNPRGFGLVGELFESWAKWAERNGDIVGSKKVFSQTLLGRQDILKIKYYQSSEGRGFRGVELKKIPGAK